MMPATTFPKASSLIKAAIRQAYKEYFEPEKPFSEVDFRVAMEACPHLLGLEALYRKASSLPPREAGDWRAQSFPAFYQEKIFRLAVGVVATAGGATSVTRELEPSLPTSTTLYFKDKYCHSGVVEGTGDSLLHLAAAENIELSVVQWTLRNGANPFQANTKKIAPILFMMEGEGQLIEYFYRFWLVKQADPLKVISNAIKSLKNHWTSIEAKLSSDEAAVASLLRRDLELLRRLKAKVDFDPYNIWELLNEIKKLAAAPRAGYDHPLHVINLQLANKLLAYLAKLANNAGSSNSKIAFIMATHVFIKLMAKERGVPESEADYKKYFHALPSDEEAFKFYFDTRLFKSDVGRLALGAMREMSIFLYSYDKNLRLREGRTTLFKLFDSRNHREERRAAVDEYQAILARVFSKESFASLVETTAEGELVFKADDRDVSAESLRAYSSYRVLARRQLELKQLAPRGFWGRSGLHDTLYNLWHPAQLLIDREWVELVTSNKALARYFAPNYKNMVAIMKAFPAAVPIPVTRSTSVSSHGSSHSAVAPAADGGVMPMGAGVTAFSRPGSALSRSPLLGAITGLVEVIPEAPAMGAARGGAGV